MTPDQTVADKVPTPPAQARSSELAKFIYDFEDEFGPITDQEIALAASTIGLPTPSHVEPSAEQ